MRDVIISAFATPGQGNLNGAGLRDWTPSKVQPLESFIDRPLLLDVPKTAAPGAAKPEDWGGVPFNRTADKYKAAGGGSILRGLFKSQAADVQPRRICMLAFSAGNSFLNQVLSNPIDAELVDTVISLDGMVFSKNGGQFVPASFKGYQAFAERATGLLYQSKGYSNPYISPLFVGAHTSIVSNSPLASSTKEAAQKLFWLVNDRYWQAAAAVPAKVKNDQGRRQNEIKARLQQSLNALTPVTVNCNGAKTYSSLSPGLGYLGNLWSLDFGGTVGSDHCMIAYVAQRAIFDAFLVPRWNSRNEAVAGLGGLGAADAATVTGEGAVWTTPAASLPGGGIVRKDVLSASPVAVAGKYAAGAAAAYLAFQLGRRLTGG